MLKPITVRGPVSRGDVVLGEVLLEARMHFDGAVTGKVVHIDFRDNRQKSVPPSFLRRPAGVDRDLRMPMGQGQVLEFTIRTLMGEIVNGRITPAM
jgi:hypothetical protein